MLLPLGQSYYLNFINTALFANEDKTVTANFVLSYERLVLVTEMTGNSPNFNMTNATMGGNMTGASNMTNATMGGNMTFQ